MGTKKRKSPLRKRIRDGARGETPVLSAKGGSDRNATRRKRYADDPEYAEEQKRRYRDYYRRTNGYDPDKASILEGGKLLARATTKNVQIEDTHETYDVLVYTIREAAQAIARSELTLRRWIRDELIPAPRLFDTTYGYMHYSRGELKIIARLLAQHERDFDYLHKSHEFTINNIRDAVEKYREYC